MKKYLIFLALSYPIALCFEILANTIGDGRLFQNPHWPIYFVLWYGLLYSVLFFIFIKTAAVPASLSFAVIGIVVEIVVFKRSNLIIDPIVYFFMALIPCLLVTKIKGKLA